MSKRIPLSKGEFAIVDDEDFVFLNRLKWSVAKVGTHKYPSTTVRTERGETYRLPMSRLLVRVVPNRRVIHRNKNGLDCRKANLEQVLTGHKVHMGKKIEGTYSKYRGVHFDKAKKDKCVWRAGITKDRQYYHLGNFDNEEDAARAYNTKALELYGEHAFQNKVEVPH